VQGINGVTGPQWTLPEQSKAEYSEVPQQYDSYGFENIKTKDGPIVFNCILRSVMTRYSV